MALVAEAFDTAADPDKRRKEAGALEEGTTAEKSCREQLALEVVERGESQLSPTAPTAAEAEAEASRRGRARGSGAALRLCVEGVGLAGTPHETTGAAACDDDDAAGGGESAGEGGR